MLKKKDMQVLEIIPADSSYRGLEELKFVLEALFADLNACKTKEEAINFLKKDQARPEEERKREIEAIIEDARRRFKGRKDS